MKSNIQQSDAELIKQYRNGNTNCLNLLFSRYQKPIFNTIYFKVKDKHVAEDIMQEVFIRIFKNLNKDTYVESGKFLSWASTIASNMVIDYQRKKKITPNTIPIELTQVSSENKCDFTQEVVYINNETNHYLTSCINKLPAAQREVLVLKLYGDVTFKAISNVTNTSINTAIGRMQYAIKNIKKIIEQREVAA